MADALAPIDRGRRMIARAHCTRAYNGPPSAEYSATNETKSVMGIAEIAEGDESDLRRTALSLMSSKQTGGVPVVVEI